MRSFDFFHADLNMLCQLLQLPERITLRNNAVIDRNLAMLMMLHRLAYPNRLHELAKFFGCFRKVISMAVNWMVKWLDRNFRRLLVLEERGLTYEKLAKFA